MLDQKPLATTGGETKKKEVEPVTAEAFAEVVAGMSRFLAKLATFKAFQDAKLGLAEWSLLTELAEEGSSNKALARDLGVSKQRIAQITETLKAAGYISVTQADDDARKNSIALTDAGRSQLNAINGELTTVLAQALAGKNRALHSTSRSLKTLTRAVSEPKSKEPSKKAAKAAAKAGAKDED